MSCRVLGRNIEKLFLRKIFKKIKPEIILSSFLNIKNFIYSIFLDSKRIILIHGSDANTQGFARKIIFKLYFNKLDKIICVSNYTKKILLKNFKNIKHKTIVIHNGFSREKLDRIDYNLKKKFTLGKIYILTVANLVPRKNVSDLIKIFYKINSKYKNKYHLNIIGQGSEKEKLEKEIKFYKLQKNISIFSNLSNPQIALFYTLSKYFFLFSKNYRHEFEGFGIVFLEAMYKKNLIFASKNGGTIDILKNNKNSFSFNVEKLNYKKNVVDTFFLLEKNRKLQKKIIKNALQYSKKFSWEKNINSIINSL
jgi:glycosyltransferase involved in cell wall biosynthesis